MIIVKEDIELKKSGTQKEVKFQVSDEGMIRLIEIASKDMYKDPIRSLVVEFVQNALDAHTVANKRDVPIEVTLPTKFDPNYRVRDFGYGMTSEEIENIFAAVGVSTKGNSNELLGAFGLGKLVFAAYGGIMNLTSISGGMKYCYFCRLQNGEGEITQIYKTETNEPSGVLIEIPIKEQDIQRIQTSAASLYRFITPRPIIHSLSDTITIPELPEGSTITDDYILTFKESPMICTIGDLPFPIDIEKFTTLSTDVRRGLSRSGIILKFKVGELDIVSSRDSLRYTEQTVAKLLNVISIILKNIHIYWQDKITTTCDSILDIFKLLLEIRRSGFSDILGSSFKFKDFNVGMPTRYINSFTLTTVEGFDEGDYTIKRYNVNNSSYSRAYISDHVDISKKRIFLKESNVRYPNLATKLKAYLDNNPTLKDDAIYVITLDQKLFKDAKTLFNYPNDKHILTYADLPDLPTKHLKNSDSSKNTGYSVKVSGGCMKCLQKPFNSLLVAEYFRNWEEVTEYPIDKPIVYSSVKNYKPVITSSNSYFGYMFTEGNFTDSKRMFDTILKVVKLCNDADYYGFRRTIPNDIHKDSLPLDFYIKRLVNKMKQPENLYLLKLALTYKGFFINPTLGPYDNSWDRLLGLLKRFNNKLLLTNIPEELLPLQQLYKALSKYKTKIDELSGSIYGLMTLANIIVISTPMGADLKELHNILILDYELPLDLGNSTINLKTKSDHFNYLKNICVTLENIYPYMKLEPSHYLVDTPTDHIVNYVQGINKLRKTKNYYKTTTN